MSCLNINHIGSAILFVIGLYIVLNRSNLIKKIIGVNIISSATCLLLFTIASPERAAIPVIENNGIKQLVVSPISSSLILLVILLNLAFTAYGLSLAVKLYEKHGSIDLDELIKLEDK